MRRRPNLLLLDEPTNHLDLEMRHALTRALAEYEGSLVLVSHDRALLRTVCDSFLLVVDGRGDAVRRRPRRLPRVADGAARGRRDAVSLPADQAAQRENRKAQRDSVAAERQQRLARRRPLAQEAEKLEARIAQLEAERKQLETQLADPEFYAQHQRRRSARAQPALHGSHQLKSATAEERWLEVHAELEAIGAA